MVDMMGGMLLMMIVAAVLLAAIIGTVVYVGVRAGRREPERVEGGRELLERRLASGEISPEEYFERESALRSSEPHTGRRGRRRG